MKVAPPARRSEVQAQGSSLAPQTPKPCLHPPPPHRAGDLDRGRSPNTAPAHPSASSSRLEGQRFPKATGTLGPIVQRPTRGLAARGTLVAVQLADPRVEGGARLDLWGVRREELLAVVPVPASAGLLALGDGFAWLTLEGELLRRLPLPQGDEPLPGPCAAVERPSDNGPGPLEPATPARQTSDASHRIPLARD